LCLKELAFLEDLKISVEMPPKGKDHVNARPKMENDGKNNATLG
jgi:hypothetical protein